MIHPDKNLLMRYLNGTCSQQEEQRVEEWLGKDPSHAHRLEFLAGEGVEPVNINTPRIKKRVMKKIGRKEAPLRSRRKARSRQVRRWMAAAVILIVSLAGGTYYYSNVASGDEKTAYIQKSMPAGQVATLTLSDGSTVQLNSGSSIRYPRQFIGGSRDVYLQGEAYFEVARDPEHPFRVRTGEVTTTVLGTAFNVRAFKADSQIQVAVNEGKVAVKSSDTGASSGQDTVMLSANQWASYDAIQKTLEKKSGNISRMIAWKDGVLLFDNKTLVEAIDIMERWYGTEITLKNKALADCVLHGKYKDENLENVLEAIGFALGINYSLTDKGVTISGGGCK